MGPIPILPMATLVATLSLGVDRVLAQANGDYFIIGKASKARHSSLFFFSFLVKFLESLKTQTGHGFLVCDDIMTAVTINYNSFQLNDNFILILC